MHQIKKGLENRYIKLGKNEIDNYPNGIESIEKFYMDIAKTLGYQWDKIDKMKAIDIKVNRNTWNKLFHRLTNNNEIEIGINMVNIGPSINDSLSDNIIMILPSAIVSCPIEISNII